MTVNRRELVINAALISSAGMLFSLPHGAASQTLRVRKNINHLPPNDPIIEAYRHAVQEMHNLPTSDERNWTSQAYMHNDHCHRQMLHFLPWHRLFLYAFEDIVRDLTNESEWALPYWNWSQDRQIPQVFFGTGEALDTKTWNDPDPRGRPPDRLMGSTDTLAAHSVGLGNMLNENIYSVFSDAVEYGPHGAVHVSVGGHMGRFFSPLDPIFMVHHCNVDRLWAHWNREHENPAQTSWLSERFDNMFVDHTGAFIQEKSASDLLDIEALAYTYDDLPPQEIAVSESTASSRQPTADAGGLLKLFDERGVGVENDRLSSVGTPTTISVAASEELQLSMATASATSVGVRGKQILARLRNIQIPTDAENYAIRIFLNCPYISEKVSPDDPHFVAEVNLFGLRKMEGMEKRDFSMLLNFTDTMVVLSQSESIARETLRDVFQVQVMPVAINGRTPKGGQFTIGRVDIISVEDDTRRIVPIERE